MALRFVPLGSGSRGNATLVELGSRRLLIDAGLSARALSQRLEGLGVAPGQIEAVFLTHEHGDHARGVERFSRQAGVPVVCHPATLDALDLSPSHLASWMPIPDDGRVDLGSVQVEAFPVPHDAAQPLGFVFHGEGMRVGVVTDIGHATTLVLERLRGCHLLMIESNHDDALLRDGRYPWHLKQRVGGRMGHLSNDEAAAILRHVVVDDCRAVVLAHLSEENNRPDLARRTAALALAEAGCARVQMRVASSRHPTPPLVL